MVNGRVYDVRQKRFLKPGEVPAPLRSVVGLPTTPSVPSTPEEYAAMASLIGRGQASTPTAPMASFEPTPAEREAKASLVERGPSQLTRRETIVRAQTAASPQSVVRVESKPLPEKFVESKQKVQRPSGNIFEDISETLIGRPGTEQKGIPGTGRGGVFQRTQSAFFGPLRAGTEFGQRVGGTPGRLAGALAGGAVGGVLGVTEAGLGTAIRLGYDVPVRRGFLLAGRPEAEAETAGQVAGGLASILTLSEAGPAAIGRLGRGAGQVVRFTPQALLRLEGLTARSIYTPGLLGRAGEVAQRGVSAAERLAGPVTQISGQIARVPIVKYPLFFGGSLAAPEVGSVIARTGESKEYQRVVQSVAGQQAVDLTFENVRSIQSSRGFVAGLGGELGLGVTEERPRIGGVSTQEVRKAAEQAFIQSGFTRAEAERFAPAAAREYKARQAGVVSGFLGVSIGTELGGAATIGPVVSSRLAGKIVGKKAFQQTLKTVAPTLPRFAAFGAIEGVESVGIAELGQRRVRRVTELPRAVAERPGQYVLGGLFGAASASVLGSLTLGGGIYRALRGGRTVLGSGTEKGALTAGYITDVYEKAGDDIARFFGKTEPRFRIRTILGVPTFTATEVPERGGFTATEVPERGGARRVSEVGVPIKSQVIEPLPVTQPLPVAQPVTEPSSIYTPENVPENVPEPTNVFEDFTGIPEQTTNETTEDISENINTALNTSLSTAIGTPVSRAGGAPFFPFLPYGEAGGGRGRGRGRRTFINEYAFATGLLGRPLLRRGRSIARERKSLFDFSRRRPRGRRRK